MRYTQCNDPSAGQRCFHRPTPILQIFNVKVQTCLADVSGRVEVYGIVAVRDVIVVIIFSTDLEKTHSISVL